MSRIAVAVAACFVVLACSTGGRAKILQPELELVQLESADALSFQQGAIEVHYGLRIANRSAEPITLRSIRIESLGSGGPYRLLRETYFFKREVAPNQFADVSFHAKAVGRGDAAAIDATAPITVRGTAYFESPAGDFRQLFVKMLTQMGGGE